jgi:hypothetical protein
MLHFQSQSCQVHYEIDSSFMKQPHNLYITSFKSWTQISHFDNSVSARVSRARARGITMTAIKKAVVSDEEEFAELYSGLEALLKSCEIAWSNDGWRENATLPGSRCDQRV